MQWVVPLFCPYTCDQHTHLQIPSNWRSPYLRPYVGFANRIFQYLTKYPPLCLNGNPYTNLYLSHTMVLTYLVHCTHILSTLFKAHDTLLTQMYDELNRLRQPPCFLVSSPLEVSNFTFALLLTLVDQQVQMISVQSARYLQILSSAWSACLRSLRASRDFCLISTLFAQNTWLTASTSLCLLPCQFLLRLFLATFMCCWFWTFFGMSRCQIPVPARCLNSLVLYCLFFIMFSCSSRRSSWHPSCITSSISRFAFGPNLPLHLSQLNPLSPSINCHLHGHSANHLLSFFCDCWLHGHTANCLLSPAPLRST